jgi:6-phosphogluconolactonase
MPRGRARITGTAVLACAIAAAVHAQATRSAGADAGTLVYVGTYTRTGSEGIYAFRFDPAAGALRAMGLAAATSNPSFLAVHPNGRWLYAVNEDDTSKGEQSGTVSAFGIDRASGRLTSLNQQSSRGAAPCHLTIDRTGRHLLVANYNGGNVAVLPIGADGRLGEATSVVQHSGSSADARRQQGAHAHAIVLDETNRFAIAADLGIDRLLVYRFDPSRGRLTPNQPPAASLPPGAGPRHVAFGASERHLYAIDELSSTISAFSWDAGRGALTAEQAVPTLPPGYKGGEQHRRDCASSVGPLPLRIEPRARQHCGLPGESREWGTDARRARTNGWPDTAELRDRSHRPLAHCRQPGLELARRVPDGSADRRAGAGR